ncbi:nuclear transport factor 2 family protein [Nocardiopsis tropica]|uniref:Nuclear transport factor 2 family protein n=1 Tax=Nocardiopsis tropica TaxID=109330 RepID=A0ABV1ZXK2_9ACTN
MTTESAETVARTAAAYISIWNERDPRARRALGDEVFAPHAVYTDPETVAEGVSAIDSSIAGWQEQFAGMVFRLGEVRAHHGLAHFDWSFGRPGEPAVGEGWDVMVLESGRISRIYGFFA